MGFWPFFKNDIARALFVAWVHEGKKINDGNGRDALFSECTGGRSHRLLV